MVAFVVRRASYIVATIFADGYIMQGSPCLKFGENLTPQRVRRLVVAHAARDSAWRNQAADSIPSHLRPGLRFIPRQDPSLL